MPGVPGWALPTDDLPLVFPDGSGTGVACMEFARDAERVGVGDGAGG